MDSCFCSVMSTSDKAAVGVLDSSTGFGEADPFWPVLPKGMNASPALGVSAYRTGGLP